MAAVTNNFREVRDCQLHVHRTEPHKGVCVCTGDLYKTFGLSMPEPESEIEISQSIGGEKGSLRTGNKRDPRTGK